MMLESSAADCTVDPGQGECPVCGLFDIFGRKWTIHLLRVIDEEDGLRFNELKRRSEGISPRVLSDRLSELTEMDLLERIDYEEVPARVEYELTEKARGLDRIFDAYLAWADRWAEPDEPEQVGTAGDRPNVDLRTEGLD